MIDGMMKLMASDDSVTGPINIGNPHEFTIRELAELVQQGKVRHIGLSEVPVEHVEAARGELPGLAHRREGHRQPLARLARFKRIVGRAAHVQDLRQRAHQRVDRGAAPERHGAQLAQRQSGPALDAPLQLAQAAARGRKRGALGQNGASQAAQSGLALLHRRRTVAQEGVALGGKPRLHRHEDVISLHLNSPDAE